MQNMGIGAVNPEDELFGFDEDEFGFGALPIGGGDFVLEDTTLNEALMKQEMERTQNEAGVTQKLKSNIKNKLQRSASKANKNLMAGESGELTADATSPKSGGRIQKSFQY